MSKTAAITGAYGYLGSAIRRRLEDEGWQTSALVRTPRAGDRAEPWALRDELPDEVLAGVDVLVHCAYDFDPRERPEIWKVNVEGTRLLLEQAQRQGVERLLVLSSMSAYEGTKQLYGQAKLAIEAETLRAGGIAIRPGLVYGGPPGGMAGTLAKVTRLPVVPVLGGSAKQFPVHVNDFTEVVLRVVSAPGWTPETFGIAQPEPVEFRELMSGLARQRGRSHRFVTVPWQVVYWTLRLAEMTPFAPALRADSVYGLVRPAAAVPGSSAFPDLLDDLRRFPGRSESPLG